MLLVSFFPYYIYPYYSLYDNFANFYLIFGGGVFETIFSFEDYLGSDFTFDKVSCFSNKGESDFLGALIGVNVFLFFYLSPNL